MQLLFTWSGQNLSNVDRLKLEAELKKKMDGDITGYWEKIRLAVLKEVDARDLTKDLRQALKDAFGALQMSKAGMRRLDILDRDEERFVNEMLFAGIMPSTSSDKANLGNDLITNLAGNTISGNFTPQQLTTMAMNIAKVLGIKNSTTGKLLQEAVDSKLVQAAVGAAKMPEIFDRVRKVREGLDGASIPALATPTSEAGSMDQAKFYDRSEKSKDSETSALIPKTVPKIHAMKSTKKAQDSNPTAQNYSNSSSGTIIDSSGSLPNSAPKKVVEERPVAVKSMPVPIPANSKVNRDVLKLLGGDYSSANLVTGPPIGHGANASGRSSSVSGMGNSPAKTLNIDPRKLEEESIREGASIQGCDLKSTTSDKICQSCGDTSKACICHKKMIDDYFGKASGGKPLEAVLHEKIDANAELVQTNEELEQDESLQAIDEQLEGFKPDSEEAKKLRAEKDAIASDVIKTKVKKKFFYKKALLNGLMNTKTPACLMANDSMFGRKQASRDLAPVYAVGNEKFCYQFDVNANDGFEKLSKQDLVMLGLFKGTMDELMAIRRDTKSQQKDGANRLGFDDKIFANEKNEGPPPLASGRNEVNWIFVRESAKVTGTTRNTENMLRRRLRDCSGPRQWGGVLLKNLEYLQPIAEACLDPIAYEMEIKKKYRTTIEALCNLKGREKYENDDLDLVPPTETKPSAELVKQKTAEIQELNAKADSYFEKRRNFQLTSRIQNLSSSQEFCKKVREEYRLIFDVLKATIFQNEAEICNEEKIRKEYNGKFDSHKYE